MGLTICCHDSSCGPVTGHQVLSVIHSCPQECQHCSQLLPISRKPLIYDEDTAKVVTSDSSMKVLFVKALMHSVTVHLHSRIHYLSCLFFFAVQRGFWFIPVLFFWLFFVYQDSSRPPQLFSLNYISHNGNHKLIMLCCILVPFPCIVGFNNFHFQSHTQLLRGNHGCWVFSSLKSWRWHKVTFPNDSCCLSPTALIKV